MLLDAHTSSNVVRELDTLQSAIGLEEFRRIFPIIKADRGSEFADAERIEHDKDGNQRTRLYYCDAYKSQQKPHVERGHEELRRILPKKVTTLDALSKADVSIISSHINSMRSTKFFGATPYSMARGTLGVLFDALSIGEIPAKEVNPSRMLMPHAMVPGTEPGRQAGKKKNQ